MLGARIFQFGEGVGHFDCVGARFPEIVQDFPPIIGGRVVRHPGFPPVRGSHHWLAPLPTTDDKSLIYLTLAPAGSFEREACC